MKKVKRILGLGLIAMIMIYAPLSAQIGSRPIPVSIGYFGHFGFQPGIKVGTEISMMGRIDSDNFSKQWFGSPQIAFFTNPGSDSNYMVNFDVGLRKRKKPKNSYSAFTLGMGYFIQSKLESFSVNLSNGDRSNKVRNSQGFLLPTLNYEYGWRTDKPMSWYFKYSIGQTLLSGNDNRMMMFLEFGVKFKIKKETKPKQQ